MEHSHIVQYPAQPLEISRFSVTRCAQGARLRNCQGRRPRNKPLRLPIPLSKGFRGSHRAAPPILSRLQLHRGRHLFARSGCWWRRRRRRRRRRQRSLPLVVPSLHQCCRRRLTPQRDPRPEKCGPSAVQAEPPTRMVFPARSGADGAYRTARPPTRRSEDPAPAGLPRPAGRPLFEERPAGRAERGPAFHVHVHWTFRVHVYCLSRTCVLDMYMHCLSRTCVLDLDRRRPGSGKPMDPSGSHFSRR